MFTFTAKESVIIEQPIEEVFAFPLSPIVKTTSNGARL